MKAGTTETIHAKGGRAAFASLALSALLGLALLGGSPAASQAGEVQLRMGGMNAAVGVDSMKERWYQTVVAQEYDFSCGAAAVATLLTYHYDDPVDEKEVFRFMWENGDQERIQREGFSLLDMRNYLEARGYPSDGFQVSLDKVERAEIPAIVLINTNGYLHFVVIKGIRDGEVLVGDPALGVTRYAVDEFKEKLANDIVFVVRTHREVAKASFNDQRSWEVRPNAPIKSAQGMNSLMPVTVLLPGINEFK